MTANVADHTGQMWLSLFNDQAEEIIGKNANDLAVMKDESESDFMAFVKRASGQILNFNCRAKQDNFNVSQPIPRHSLRSVLTRGRQDTVRVRYTVNKVVQPDFVAEGKLLVEAIDKYL